MVEEEAKPPRENKQTQRSRESTARMLDAASELIIESGYSGMTLAAIGERSKYSRGLATSRFGSKEMMLQALVEQLTHSWTEQFVHPAIKGKSGYDAIFVWLEAVHDEITRNSLGIRTLNALYFQALDSNVPDLRQGMIDRHEEMLVNTTKSLRRGIQDGSVRHDLAVEDEAASIIAELRGICYLWSLEPDKFDAAAAMRHLISTRKQRLRPALGDA
jgi:AcrR family transcriptional regulator